MTLLTKINHFIEHAIVKVAVTTKWVGGGVLLGMTLFKVADIILRYIFNRPIAAGVELEELGLIVLVFFSMIHCAASKENIVIDVLISKFQPRVRAIVFSAVTFFGVVLFVVIGFQCIKYAMELKQTGYVTMMLRIPYYPFPLMVGICSLCISLILLTQLIQSIMEIARK